MARFTATVRASASGVPPNWKVWPAFRKYGIAIVSSTKRETADEATLVLTASQDMKLAYSLANRTTGKDINSMPRSVEIDKVGQEHRVTVFFPESGEYELGLFAQANGEEGYSSLARVSFSAQVVPGPVLPANWEVFPRFRKFGIGVVVSPARDVGDELEIVLSVPEGWESSVDLREKGPSDPVRTIVSEIAGKEQRITAVLPKSGDYELGLSGKVSSEKYEQSIARVSFKATVDDERSPYRLWRIGGRWPRLPVKQVQSFKEQWRPFGEYPFYEQYRKGILTEEITISTSQGLFALAKGTAVTFSSMYGSEFLVDVVFANLAKDATIAIDGNALFAPKSSRLLFRNDRLSEAELTGRPTFTVGSRVYECAGSVLVEEYGEAGSPVRVRIMTAKEYALKVGTTSFTLPPGSLITFVRQRVDRVVFAKDSRVTIAGAVETIPAGWGFQFDDQGGGRKLKAE